MYTLEMYALNQFIKSKNTRLYRRNEHGANARDSARDTSITITTQHQNSPEEKERY